MKEYEWFEKGKMQEYKGTIEEQRRKNEKDK